MKLRVYSWAKHRKHTHTVHTSSLSSGDTFTFSDVTRNVLLYRHAGISNQEDAITFSVSDGISMATTVVQVVVLSAGGNGPQRDPAASLSLEVGEKSSTVIRRSHLAYTVSGRRCILTVSSFVWHLVLLLSHSFSSLAGRHFPRRPNSDPAGVGADVRHPDQEPAAAGAPGAEGVLLLHHGGHQ